MRHILTLLTFLLILSTAHAQAPQGIPYQAAARNSSGAILASTSVSVRFTIRDSITNGIIKYHETHSTTTDANGMFSLTVGQGTPLTGTFSSIKWGTNAKFMQVELDPTGGSSYIDMGTQQMMSVPYALNAGAVKLIVSATGDTLYSGNGNYVIIPGISAANTHLTIGMSYGGGKIAYILQPGDPGYIVGETRGIIAAPSDQSTGIVWWNGSYISTGATATAIGAGKANTNTIVAAQGAGSYAAKLCADLVLGGYSDWYLPSRDELSKLYLNRASVGGFATGSVYWSSSEINSGNSFYLYFGDGNAYSTDKATIPMVRAVRSFGCPEIPSTITGTATVCVGSSTTLSNATTGGTWSSSAAGVATVGSTGIVSSVTSGTATISYTVTESCGSAYTTLIVTVNDPPSSGTITGTATLTAGNTTTFSNATTGGTWSSSNTAIATIGTGGIVSGIAAGTATISYTVTNSCGSAVAATVVTVSSSLAVGASYGGGKIAYILISGDPGYIAGETHGIIAAPSDQSTGIQWGCFGTLVGGTYTALGTGAANTAIVSAACGGGTAARLCAILVLGGYSDWYLPSRDELHKLFINRLAIGGFTTGYYWNSSESSALNASSFYFSHGYSADNNKNNSSAYVRAVRAF